ncbi:hypothetical protein ANO11243_060510 [Dothideomycetidae sp. 11243]|nr:hypothetical protein ANO11243_060510 [fungal sp. No.11243]
MATGSAATAQTPRPILRKKKSVTFHPSTKPSSPRPDTVKPPSTKTAPANGTPQSASTKTSSTAFDALPSWRQDNHFILTGYRSESGSHLNALPSLFALHNETCNIWSHLLGLILFGSIGLYLHFHGLATYYPAHTPGDAAALSCFFAGVCSCMAFSSAYHLFSDVGEHKARVWHGLDYAGIVACVWGSFVAILHFGFPDDGNKLGRDVGRGRRRGYETMISALAVLCATVSVTPRFRTPQWRAFRAAMFVAMGLSAVFPVVHGVAIYGRAQLEKQMGLSWVVLQGALYVLGAALYAGRVPERFAPGKFDIVGASHQIFHTLVVLAAAAHLVGLLKALDYACSLR